MANGAQCLSSLKADKTLLVKAARGGCCNKELGGWRSAPVSSGYKNKTKAINEENKIISKLHIFLFFIFI